ncbi:hypothetical protein ACQP2F_18015 [Actinoplanes sp. CA-030573]|uniref:hypothetical protein n=1 Tax=Actinoplanes sp. CA-030573 TaxID=3239898 RepID=UPI003D93BACA
MAVTFGVILLVLALVATVPRINPLLVHQTGKDLSGLARFNAIAMFFMASVGLISLPLYNRLAGRRLWIWLLATTAATLAALVGHWVVGLIIYGVALMATAAAAWVFVAPARIAPEVEPAEVQLLDFRDRLEFVDARLKLQNEVRNTAIQTVTALAVLAGAVVAFEQVQETNRQAQLARELTVRSQANERFTQAIQQLGDNRLEVRLGGIYGIGQVMAEASENRIAGTEVLAAYLHRRSPVRRPPAARIEPGSLRARAPDTQAVLDVLSYRGAAVGDPSVNLSSLDLRGAVIGGRFGLDGCVNGDLGIADFSNSDLRASTFICVKMEYSIFPRADLRRASFELSTPTAEPGEAPPKPLMLVRLRNSIVDHTTKWPPGFDSRGVTG